MRTLLTAGLSIVLVFGALSVQALPSETWLVSIGNNQGDLQDVSLLYAERDAQEVAEVLRTEGGIATHRTMMLLGEDAETVRRELLRVNTSIRSSTVGRHRTTALIVFYSGHADADALHLGDSALPFDELRALVESSPASLRLLVVDACRSGSVTRVKGVEPAESFEIAFEDEVTSEGFAIITSSAAGESSQESDRLRASFFTHHLVGALRGAADRDQDGRITLDEAYGYTYDRTLRSSGRTLDLQHPTYQYDVKGRGALVLTTPVERSAAAGQLRLAEAGTYLVSEQHGGGPVVAEVSPERDRATLALPVGEYFVQQRLSGEYREFKVAVSSGTVVDLAGQHYDSVAYDRLVRRRGGGSKIVHGLSLVAGGRGEVFDGEGPSPQLVLGYGLDLPWLSLGIRVRGMTLTVDGLDGAPNRHHSEIGLGLVLQRYFDLRWLSLSFGVIVEGVYHHQRFDTSREAPDREAFGASFAGLLGVERRLWKGLSLRIEGGPVTTLFDKEVSARAGEQKSELQTSFTWWVAGGLTWRL